MPAVCTHTHVSIYIRFTLSAGARARAHTASQYTLLIASTYTGAYPGASVLSLGNPRREFSPRMSAGREGRDFPNQRGEIGFAEDPEACIFLGILEVSILCIYNGCKYITLG